LKFTILEWWGILSTAGKTVIRSAKKTGRSQKTLLPEHKNKREDVALANVKKPSGTYHVGETVDPYDKESNTKKLGGRIYHFFTGRRKKGAKKAFRIPWGRQNKEGFLGCEEVGAFARPGGTLIAARRRSYLPSCGGGKEGEPALEKGYWVESGQAAYTRRQVMTGLQNFGKWV